MNIRSGIINDSITRVKEYNVAIAEISCDGNNITNVRNIPLFPSIGVAQSSETNNNNNASDVIDNRTANSDSLESVRPRADSLDPSYESKRLSRSLSRKIKENKSISRGARVDDMSNYSSSMPTNGVNRSELTEFLRSSSISSLYDNNNSSSSSTTGTSNAGSSSVVGTPLRPNGIGNNNSIAPLTTPARVRNSSSTTTNSDFSVSPTMMETCFAPPSDLPSVRLRILDPPTTVLPISGSGLTSTSLNGFSSCAPVPSRPTLSKLPIPALDKLPTASTSTSSFDPINTQKNNNSSNSNSSYSFRSGNSYPHNSKLAAIPTPTIMAADTITNSTTTVASFKGGNASKATKSSSSSTTTIISTSSTNTICTIPVSVTAPPSQRAIHESMMMGTASSAQTSLSNEQYNDILLQERLHEAKAMIRKSESGAVMHKFSLWNKVSKEANNDSSGSGSIISVDVSAVMEQSSTTYQSAVAAAASSSTDEELIQREREKSLLSLDAPIVSEATATVQDQSTSSSSLKESPPLRNPSSSVTSASTIEHQGPKKKSCKVRGPKVAIKVNRGIHRDSDTDNYRSDEVSHHAHKGTRTSSALVYPSLGNSSTGITATVVSLVTASCDVDDEIEEEVKEPRSRSGSGYMMSSGGGLASSLRSKVVVAKQMSSSTSLNTIDSAVAVVDSMMDACDGRTSNAADSSPDAFEPIDELTELQNSNDGDGDYYEISDEYYDDDDNENESLSSVEEDEELRRYYMSRRKSMDDISIKFNEIDFDQNSVVHVMSQSGPATFANYSKSNPTLSIQSSSSSMTNHSGKDIHISNNDATSTATAAAFHHNGNDNHRMMRRINSNESITNSIVDETLRRESISTMAAFRSSNELLLPSLPTSTHTINSGSSSATSIHTPLEHISNSNLTKSTSKYEKLKNLRANSARKKDSIHEGVATKLYEDAHDALSEDEHHVAIKPYDHTSQVKVMSSHNSNMVSVDKILLTDPISNSSISREDYANSPTLSELSDIDELSVVHNNINNNNNNYNNNNNNNNNNKRNMYGYNNENHSINNNNNNNNNNRNMYGYNNENHSINNNNNNNNNNRNMYGYNNENHNINNNNNNNYNNNNNNNNNIASHINNFKDQLDTTSSHTHHHVSHHLMESTSNRYHYDNNVIHSKDTHGDAVVGVTDRDSSGIESPPLQWRKGEVIGEGTFGKVFKGLNERTGELIAIKQLCLFDSSDSKEILSLRKEISVMWNLEHENIVRYLGTSRTDRYLFIVLEYVTGGSISGMIQQFGAFSEKLVRRFSCHILSGVQYLHSKGIIHRDIKGANILVDASCGVAKLADFGCSKQLLGIFTGSIEESMKAIRGSVPWMAPEVIKQSGHGRPADIWSVGATMIEMATGKPPWPEFSNNNFATLFHVATSTTPPPIPKELSSDCRHCISMCMMIDPTERLTAQQLVDDCEFISDELKSNGSKASANATAALVIANEQLKKFDSSEQI